MAILSMVVLDSNLKKDANNRCKLDFSPQSNIGKKTAYKLQGLRTKDLIILVVTLMGGGSSKI